MEVNGNLRTVRVLDGESVQTIVIVAIQQPFPTDVFEDLKHVVTGVGFVGLLVTEYTAGGGHTFG